MKNIRIDPDRRGGVWYIFLIGTKKLELLFWVQTFIELLHMFNFIKVIHIRIKRLFLLSSKKRS